MIVSSAALADVVPAWTASQQKNWGADFLFPTNIPVRLGEPDGAASGASWESAAAMSGSFWRIPTGLAR